MRKLEIREPGRVWLTADWHLSHDGSPHGMAPITQMGRPYESCGEAHRKLVEATAGALCPGDTLIMLGDLVALDVHDADIREFVPSFPGVRTHLVLGNHDEGVSDAAWESAFGEEFVHEGLELVLPDIENDTHDGFPLRVICYHYPLMTRKGERFGNIHLHGHLHAFASYNESQRAMGKRRYDVGVDANGFAPVRLSDVLAFMGVPLP